jgi:hypothetical protein
MADFRLSNSIWQMRRLDSKYVSRKTDILTSQWLALVGGGGEEGTPNWVQTAEKSGGRGREGGAHTHFASAPPPLTCSADTPFLSLPVAPALRILQYTDG